ncbi:MAG: antibiotic biosynthesis monooxygenase [Pseudonocardiales bacterium]|nr:MAG: antibiotic biosynthesis monooxygenase [Pseudonocardiales bacterium]
MGDSAGIMTVGVLAKFEFKAGNEAAVERFFQHGQLVVEGQPATTLWFAYRLGTTTYGAFAVFASDEDREALLSSGGPKASRESADLFERPPSFEKVEIVAARTAG